MEYVAEERKAESLEGYFASSLNTLPKKTIDSKGPNTSGFREENVPDKHRPALKAAKAWAMKESLNDVWKYLSSGWARRFVKRWLVWVNKLDLALMRKVGEMTQRHLENILTFCRHRITSGVAEGLNSKIMVI